MSAIGGEPVTTTVEGRESYSVNVRYLRDYRSTWRHCSVYSSTRPRARRFRWRRSRIFP